MLTLDFAQGAWKKIYIHQMVVNNGDESHGIESEKTPTKTNKSKL